MADSGDVQTAAERLAAALRLSVLVEDRQQGRVGGAREAPRQDSNTDAKAGGELARLEHLPHDVPAQVYPSEQATDRCRAD